MRWLAVLAVAVAALAAGQDRPNILWITSEDNGAEWLGCYGNKDAKTPRLDALAAEGIRFQHAYANAPVCAVARSTILTGAHAVTMGSHNQRSRYPIPERFTPFVTLLRQAGYHCTNNAKTDYNLAIDDRALWDDSSRRAHWRSRPERKPFFAVFNLGMTHESSLFPREDEAPPTRDPGKVAVPPYLPDLPEVRLDIARYHDRITQMDTRVGELLDELEQAGLAESTIVFYFSDHGGVLPRSKRYLKDSGTRVPMIIRVPERWGHLSPWGAGIMLDEPVSFVDLAPTVLSLAGAERAETMIGRALLGKNRDEPELMEMEFLYADRFDDTFTMRRAVTNGKVKLIVNYRPDVPGAPNSFYPMQMPSWTAYRQAVADGRLPMKHALLWSEVQPTEELYDLQNDPYELDNLAALGNQKALLDLCRAILRRQMKQADDKGFLPEAMFATSMPANLAFDFDRAWRLSTGSPLQPKPVFLDGSASLADLAIEARFTDDPLHARSKLNYPSPIIRVLAAQNLIRLNRRRAARQTLLTELERGTDNPILELQILDCLKRCDGTAQISDAWIERTLKSRTAHQFTRRFAEKLRRDRQAPTSP